MPIMADAKWTKGLGPILASVAGEGDVRKMVLEYGKPFSSPESIWKF